MFMNTEGEYGKYIVQELNNPNTGTPEFQRVYNNFAKRILWIDGNLVPGAFQMNTSWYHSIPEINPIFDEHAHDSDELIGFFSSDPENPYDLPAESTPRSAPLLHSCTVTCLGKVGTGECPREQVAVGELLYLGDVSEVGSLSEDCIVRFDCELVNLTDCNVLDFLVQFLCNAVDCYASSTDTSEQFDYSDFVHTDFSLHRVVVRGI